MLFQQIIDFELRGTAGSLYGRTFTPKTDYFSDKTKILRQIFEWVNVYC